MISLFQGCRSLTSIDVTNFNTSQVTNMKHMFYDCDSLTSIDLSNFAIEQVSRMEYMFYKCSNLKYIDISTFDFENIKIVSLFNSLPDRGFIRIKKNLYERIKEDIPVEWEVSIVELS